MARYVGDILRHLDDNRSAEAQGWIERAIEADKRNGMNCDLGRDYALYGDFFKRRGKSPKAKEWFEKAIEVFKACGAVGWVRQTQETLSKV